MERIRGKIRQIEKLCNEVLRELDSIGKRDSPPKRSAKEKAPLPTEAECQVEFDKLYEMFLEGNSGAVEEFVRQKTEVYLKVFSKANNLSVDTSKASKEKITNEILQWFAQRKAITG